MVYLGICNNWDNTGNPHQNFIFVEPQLIYTVILVSDIQHIDSVFFQIELHYHYYMIMLFFPVLYNIS